MPPRENKVKHIGEHMLAANLPLTVLCKSVLFPDLTPLTGVKSGNRTEIACDGVQYLNHAIDTNINIGTQGPQNFVYQLVDSNNNNLGEIKFIRKQAFDDLLLLCRYGQRL